MTWKYKLKLKKYLMWVPDVEEERGGFQNPCTRFPVALNPNGSTPEDIMFDWESRGIKFPNTCTSPFQLYLYSRGKWWRDWHISEWTKELKWMNERGFPMTPAEFYGVLGMDHEELRNVFKWWIDKYYKTPGCACEWPREETK
jgi:hypothetical protein